MYKDVYYPFNEGKKKNLQFALFTHFQSLVKRERECEDIYNALLQIRGFNEFICWKTNIVKSFNLQFIMKNCTGDCLQ